MYLRNDTCIEYDMFAPDFKNEFDNFLCEVDRDQQSWFWTPLNNFSKDVSASWNNIVPPEFIGTAILILGFLFIVGVGVLIYFLPRILRYRKKKGVRKADFQAPVFNPSSDVGLKKFDRLYPTKAEGLSSDSTYHGRPRSVPTQEFEVELEDFWRAILRRGGTRELLIRARRYLNENGRYKKAVDELGVRTTLEEHLEALLKQQQEELGELPVSTM